MPYYSWPGHPHRIPEPIAHIAEALWMQALEEAKRRAALEHRDTARLTELDKQRLELRSHVLSLREGELDSRLRDRDRTIEELNARLRELNGILRKEQAIRESLSRQLVERQFAQARKQGVRKSKKMTRKRRAKSKITRLRGASRIGRNRRG
jgi:hypothetical protein